MDFLDNDIFTSSTFFEPDEAFLKWIINKADGRLIFDIGCGNGTVLRGIKNLGYSNIMGIDPYSDMQEFKKACIEECGTGGMIQFMPYGVETEMVRTLMAKYPKDKVLFILCRPCHSTQLITGSLELARISESELLYIGLEENVYNDLDLEEITYDRVIHKGTSRDSEIVLQLN